jgi:PKD repeat protein
MNNSWVLRNCEFIAAFQDMDAGQGNIPGTTGYAMKEYKVYQTIKQGAIVLTPGFTASDTTVPLNGTVTFTNTTLGGYVGTPETFHWIFDGGTPDTSDLKNPTVVYSASGSHDVTLIVNNGGQIDTLTKTGYIYVGYTGINELSQNAVTLFPNPAKEFITVQSTSYIKDINIYNENGQIVINQTINAKTITINTTGLSDGIYYLKANTNSGSIIKKFVIQ